MSEYNKEPTEKTYHLTCVLKFYNKTVHDHDRIYDRTLCFLVPQESDQRTSFLNAWLPEVQSQFFELASIILPPIDSPARLSVHRSNSMCDKHYLFVMTGGVEEDLLKLKEGTRIQVKILPESGEDIVDQAKDVSHGNHHLINGQESF